MDKDEALRIALEALVDFGWHIENCPQFPTWAEPKKYPSCTCGYDTAKDALRQALDHVPDTTKMIEPDMGIDRGAWDDVPDATKWVDELRGGDETEQEPVAFVCRGKLSTIRHCEECEPLYTAPPKREWVDLTEEQIFEIWVKSPAETEDRFAFVKAVITELKEKNT